MKTGPDSIDTAKNESGRVNHEYRTRRPRVPPKMSSVAQNMKTGPDDLGTAENESGSAKTKTGLYALGTAENESGRAKPENGSLRPRYR
jgi:hypothetical protein